MDISSALGWTAAVFGLVAFVSGIWALIAGIEEFPPSRVPLVTFLVSAAITASLWIAAIWTQVR